MHIRFDLKDSLDDLTTLFPQEMHPVTTGEVG
jgi:hypothetical protein